MCTREESVKEEEDAVSVHVEQERASEVALAFGYGR